jgi:hypothetical protein
MRGRVGCAELHASKAVMKGADRERKRERQTRSDGEGANWEMAEQQRERGREWWEGKDWIWAGNRSQSVTGQSVEMCWGTSRVTHSHAIQYANQWKKTTTTEEMEGERRRRREENEHTRGGSNERGGGARNATTYGEAVEKVASNRAIERKKQRDRERDSARARGKGNRAAA